MKINIILIISILISLLFHTGCDSGKEKRISNLEKKLNLLEEEKEVQNKIIKDFQNNKNKIVTKPTPQEVKVKKPAATNIYVVGTVDYKEYKFEFKNGFSSKHLTKEGFACSPISEISTLKLNKFKNDFYNCLDVQFNSIDNQSSGGINYGYTTFPKSIKIKKFGTYDEAFNYTVNNCTRQTRSFHYLDF